LQTLNEASESLQCLDVASNRIGGTDVPAGSARKDPLAASSSSSSSSSLPHAVGFALTLDKNNNVSGRVDLDKVPVSSAVYDDSDSVDTDATAGTEAGRGGAVANSVPLQEGAKSGAGASAESSAESSAGLSEGASAGARRKYRHSAMGRFAIELDGNSEPSGIIEDVNLIPESASTYDTPEDLASLQQQRTSHGPGDSVQLPKFAIALDDASVLEEDVDDESVAIGSPVYDNRIDNAPAVRSRSVGAGSGGDGDGVWFAGGGSSSSLLGNEVPRRTSSLPSHQTQPVSGKMSGGVWVHASHPYR
jgi:hypothetical protein